MQWVRAALLVCAMVWFVSCSTDESPVASDQAYDAAEEQKFKTAEIIFSNSIKTKKFRTYDD